MDPSPKSELHLRQASWAYDVVQTLIGAFKFAGTTTLCEVVRRCRNAFVVCVDALSSSAFSAMSSAPDSPGDPEFRHGVSSPVFLWITSLFGDACDWARARVGLVWVLVVRWMSRFQLVFEWTTSSVLTLKQNGDAKCTR
ncbi:hypothetical protein IscW_ISCW013431 [Ixodes scapularis]|uniref:Uncharacterized protein n=1 Tax=Ixodes scapularis TaxID=6945 RepID=B7QCZ3_IXOSC|nr:hypothetical protein IscW_ISCW013431 [Ixodes scapularis]|eukprot:XP_002413407.1 hypothetical protein IscW_ISCW013431 [Ixodes scapularis]